MKRTILAVALLAISGFGLAKIPAPVLDDAAKAKAAEAAAKTAWQAKLDTYQLCKAQDRVAAYYQKASGKAVDIPAKDAKAAAKTPAAATPAASAASGLTTPVASAAPPPCADPGPFAYNAPAQKPLETSEAHSPAGNATSPPSVRSESAKMAPSPAPAKK